MSYVRSFYVLCPGGNFILFFFIKTTFFPVGFFSLNLTPLSSVFKISYRFTPITGRHFHRCRALLPLSENLTIPAVIGLALHQMKM